MSIANCIDAYKADHRRQYPDDSETVFSNWTPRKSRVEEIDKVMLLTLQVHVKRDLIDRWNNEFFRQPKAEVIAKYKRRISNAGINISYDHMEALHDLGYLPIHIMSLPEGTMVPVGCPMFVMWNTHKDFAWVVNYLESKLSNAIWMGCTSATTANWYREEIDYWIEMTGGDPTFVQWQGHDFSYRGMPGEEAAQSSGAGHLMSFTGSDTFPAADYLEDFYFADCEKELILGSVVATEHSVMCMGGGGRFDIAHTPAKGLKVAHTEIKYTPGENLTDAEEEEEYNTFLRLISVVYPDGIISIVSDTWDYWKVITNYLPRLKNVIMARNGTVTIRPDSGDPVKIICGDPDAEVGSPEYKGSVQCLWDTFGGTISPKGYQKLDSHINLIYGDSITMKRCRQICAGLVKKKFVPSIILGIGSYTYQYVTRDTYGFAMKATFGVVAGVPKLLFKDPKTDSGMKKSHRGLLAVFRDCNGEIFWKQEATWEEVLDCEFRTVLLDSVAHNTQSLSEIRAIAAAQRADKVPDIEVLRARYAAYEQSMAA